MFTKQKINSALDREIESALKELEKNRDNQEKYDAIVDRIATLQKQKPRGLVAPSMDTVLIVGANLFGILYLARFERDGNVIKTPKSFGFILKPGANTRPR